MKLVKPVFAYLALFLSLVGAATPALAAPKVAVLAASFSTGPDIVGKLQASGAFQVVDLIAVHMLTPTVQQLQAYDAVLVYSQTGFSSPTALGDNLATYLEGGGGVVLADWEALEQGFAQLGGRFVTTYSLMNATAAGSVLSTATSLGQVLEPGSSLMSGVNTFTCPKAPCHRLPASALKNNAAVVAKWADGSPLIVRGSTAGRVTVELNMFPVSTAVPGGEWDTTSDGANLLRNALLYVIPSALKANVGSVSFPNTPVGQSSPKVVTYTNSGVAALTVTQVKVAGVNPGEFQAFPAVTLPKSIPPGGTLDVTVAFVPSAVSSRAAVLQATVQGSPATVDTDLVGSGIGATLGVMPNVVQFGGGGVGMTLKKTVTVTNNSNAQVNLTDAQMTLNGAEFTFAPTFALPVTLPVGASFDFNATLTPSQSGTRTGVATITVQGQSAIQVLMVGSAGDAAVAIGNNGVIFGNTHVGSVSAPQTLTVSNVGYADLHVSSILISGQNAGDFGLTTPKLPATIAPGGTISYGVLFKPMALGQRSAGVTIVCDDPQNGTVAFTIAGSGVAYGQSVAPQTLDFMSVKAGTTAPPQQAAITNTSKAPLVVKKVLIAGQQASAFSLVMPPADNSAIQPGASLPVSVSFKPTNAGLYAATLTFFLDDPNMPSATVALKGTGTAGMLSVTPLLVDFGGVPFGKSSAAKTLTLTNAGGAPLSITGLNFMGPDAGSFDSPNKPMVPAAIPAGGTLSFDLVYTPTLRATQTATLAISSDDPVAPNTVVQLKGSGTQAKLSVTPLMIDFGVTTIGSPTDVVPITITNTGDQALPIANISLGGAGAAQFRLDSNPAPIMLDPGSSTMATARFSPTQAGTITATLSVVPGDQGVGSAVVMLRGIAVALNGAVGIMPSTLDFGVVNVGQSSDPQIVQLKNTTPAMITLTPIVSSNPAFVLDTSMTTLTLAAGGQTSFTVVFTPVDTMDQMGKADVALATAPNKPVATATFTGQGVTPKIPGTTRPCSLGNSLGARRAAGSLASLAPLAIEPEVWED